MRMTGQGPPFLQAPPSLSIVASPLLQQSSILDLVDIFAPAPALPSTHCSADPWDIPGGHAGLQEAPRLAPREPLPSQPLAGTRFRQLRTAGQVVHCSEPQHPLCHRAVVWEGAHLRNSSLWEIPKCSLVAPGRLGFPGPACP